MPMHRLLMSVLPHSSLYVHQMIFGKRPFGDGMTQERVIQDRAIMNSTVDFPPTPKVSEEAKDFIRACLTRDPHLRYVTQYIF